MLSYVGDFGDERVRPSSLGIHRIIVHLSVGLRELSI
jgi:hypothetical protein